MTDPPFLELTVSVGDAKLCAVIHHPSHCWLMLYQSYAVISFFRVINRSFNKFHGKTQGSIVDLNPLALALQNL